MNTIAHRPMPGFAWLRKSHRIMRLYLASAFSATVLIPLIFAEFDYPQKHTFLATILIVVCAYPMARYFSRKESGLPAMALFCGAYALQFAFPVFTRDAIIRAYNDNIYLQDSDVTAALWLAIVGILAFQGAYYWLQRSHLKGIVPTVRLELNNQKAVVYCVLVGILFPLLFTFKGIIPEEYQLPLSAILRLLENQILVVIGILGWFVYSHRGSKIYAVWLYGLIIAAALRGVSTGMLEAALAPVGVFFVVKWLYTSKVPVGPIIATVVLFLFLSPVKYEFRDQSWYGEVAEEDRSMFTKGFLWVELATEYWKDTLEGNRGFAEATANASVRTDLIHQVAYMYSLTPSEIPFQNGATYSYFAVAFIPRIFWPDKPLAGSANNFYAVAYGISTEEGTKTSTFGITLLGEAYINFGWPGVVAIMLLQGLILGMLKHSFGESASGPGGQAVFLAFFVFFLNGIGSSAEILFGNILQNLLCGYFLLLWAREKPSKSQVADLSLAPPALSR